MHPDGQIATNSHDESHYIRGKYGFNRMATSHGHRKLRKRDFFLGHGSRMWHWFQNQPKL